MAIVPKDHTEADRAFSAQDTLSTQGFPRPLDDGAFDDLASWVLLEATPDGLVVCDIDGTIVFLNGQLEAMTGYDRVELLGQRVELLVPEVADGPHRAHRLRYQAKPTVRQMGEGRDLVMRCKNGTHLAVEISLSPVTVKNQTYTVVGVRDVREKRVAEQRIASSEAAFRAAFELAPVGMVVTELGDDGSRTVVRANQAFADFLGVSPQDLVGVSPASFTHPDDDTLDQVATQEQLSGRAAHYRLEKRYRRADGSYVWGELHSSTTKANGRERLSHVIDVDQIRTENERRARAERLKRTVGDIAVALFSGNDANDVLARALRELAESFRATSVSLLRREPATGEVGRVVAVGEMSDSDPSHQLVAPLHLSDEGVDSLVVEREHESFSEVDEELLTNFAAQIGPLFELDGARSARRRLELLEDRERIARDLHDTVIQDLFAIGMQLAGSAQRVTDTALQAKLEEVVEQVDGAIRRLRGTIFELRDRASHAERERLTDSLTATIREASRVLDHRPSLNLVGPVDDVDDQTVSQIIPALREALSNVARHAHASSTVVTVVVDETNVLLRVEDNGVGFANDAPIGSGIGNLQERASCLGGSATIASSRPHGCRVEWTVPRQRSSGQT